MRRAPTFVVALSAAVVELVLLAAAGNQWVYDHLTKHPSAHEPSRNREVKNALLAFPWRLTPQSHQRMIWLGQIVADVGLVVVLFLLVLALVRPMRPPRAFISVFFGTWGIVIGVTQLAAIGRSLLGFGDMFPRGRDPNNLGRFWYSVFNGPSSHTVLFAAASGLIVAIVTGAVAAASSHRAEEEEDEEGPVLSAEPDELPSWSSAIGAPSTVGATQAFGGDPTRAFGGESGRGLGGDPTRGPDGESTRAFGGESGRGFGREPTRGLDRESTRGFSDDATRSFGGPPSQAGDAGPTSTERTAAWPPPDPASTGPGWPPAQSATRRGVPASTEPPPPPPASTEPPPPPSLPPPPPLPPLRSRPPGRPWARPGQRGSSGEWSNVTESTTEFSGVRGDVPDPADESPSEITMPRLPRPTGQPSSPDAARPQSARLPLPEERE